MKLRFFMIPTQDSDAATEELNQHLAASRVLTVERQLVSEGSNNSWSVCVVSQSGSQRPDSPGRKPAVDYQVILNAEDFAAATGGSVAGVVQGAA